MLVKLLNIIQVFCDATFEEGDGFTDQQLLDLGKKVGIEGDSFTTFETCVSSAKYKGWAQNSQLHAQDRGVQRNSFFLP